MHKCFKCGTEFEGSFCPECGTQWQEQKYCPQCWALLSGSAKFCNNCGYSFVESTEKKTPKKRRKQNKFGKWLKKHLKAVIASACALVVLVVMLSLIPTFILTSVNGTYYAYSLDDDGELLFSEKTFVKLSSGKWKDERGNTGKYKLSGKNITLIYEDEAAKDFNDMFGNLGGAVQSRLEMKGICKNGVLTITEGEREQVFATKRHKHKYGKWKTTQVATCTNEGARKHTCDCKKSETKAVAALGHNFKSDQNSNTDHICERCRTKTKHTVNRDNVCSGCGETWRYTNELKFSGSDENYQVSGYVKFPKNVVIAYYYEGKFVTAIGDEAFKGCMSMESITIPNSVTSIGELAFYYCTSLTIIKFQGTKQEWNQISKGEYWNYNTGDFTIQCDDGKLDKEGNEIA